MKTFILKHHRKLVLILVLSIYLFSLILPVFKWGEHYDPVSIIDRFLGAFELTTADFMPIEMKYGFYILLIGWLGVLQPIPVIGWYANVGLFITIKLYAKRNQKCLPWSFGALFIALLSLVPPTIDIGFTRYVVLGYGVGFYMWLIVFVIMCVACFIQARAKYHLQNITKSE